MICFVLGFLDVPGHSRNMKEFTRHQESKKARRVLFKGKLPESKVDSCTELWVSSFYIGKVQEVSAI